MNNEQKKRDASSADRLAAKVEEIRALLQRQRRARATVGKGSSSAEVDRANCDGAELAYLAALRILEAP